MEPGTRQTILALKEWLYLAQAILLAGLTLAVYRPGLHSPFQYDDFASVVENRFISIESLSPHALLSAAFQTRLQNRPLTNLSFALNYYFNGLDPFGYHLVNLLALLVTAIGVWALLHKLMLHLGYDALRAKFAAWLAALVWALHPANVMAVTYITQRHSSFAGMFSIWSIYFFHLAAERPKNRLIFSVLCGFLCLLALLSKETAATLPAIIFAYKIYFFDGLKPSFFRKNWKWIVALLIFYALAASVMLRPAMLEKTISELNNTPISAGHRMLSQPRVLAWYPFLVLFPFPQFLTLLHNFEPSSSLMQPPSTIISILLIFAIIFLAVWKARSWKLFSFAVLWYFGELLVESMPLPIALANEHRLYLASLSILAPLAAWPALRSKKIFTGVCLAAIVAGFFGFFTYSRNLDWRSEESLWRDTATKSPGFLWAWLHYCNASVKAGKCGNAILSCGLGVKAAPDDFRPHFNLGVCYLRAGYLGSAEPELIKAAELNPALEDDPVWKAAFQELINTLVLNGKCDEAEKLIEFAPGKVPNLEQITSRCRKQK